MGIFKLRKNKKFNYTPRHFDNGGETPFQIKHKFDDYRKTVGDNKGLKTKFKNAFEDLKQNQDQQVNRRILVIIGILLLAFLFLIDFDLSIFFSTK